MLKSRSNSAPYASTIVSPRTRKPQNDERVRQAGDRPLEQPALTDDLGDLGLEHRAGVDVPAQRRLAAADQPPQPVQAPPGDGQRDDGDEEADEEAHAHTLDPTHQ